MKDPISPVFNTQPQTKDLEIPVGEWSDHYNWVEDFHTSPDGKIIAAIVNLGEAQFSICTNGQTWDETFEKAWSLKFNPDSTPLALVSRDEEWTICQNGICWENRFDFIWNLNVSANGEFIGAAVQQDMMYGLAVNDTVWDTLYENIFDPVFNGHGSSAAIVQSVHMDQADINRFKSGIYAVAVNGEIQTDEFMNIWSLTFDEQGKQIAYTIRKDRERYTLGVDRQLWKTNFQSVWDPVFIENGKSVIAPVRKDGKWYLYKNDQRHWQKSFGQLWKLTPHHQSDKIAAVVSDRYGLWTVCENDYTWDIHCDTMISDLIYSLDGRTLLAVCKHQGFWDIAVNGVPWGIRAEKLWTPVLSPDGKLSAVRLEKGGRHFLAVNGKIYPKDYDQLFDPVILEDGSGLIVKSINDDIYSRQILDLEIT